jgi:hypothetical protein
MLLPPPQEPGKPDDEKRTEAVSIDTRLIEERGTWKRITTYWYDGEDFQYSLEALPMNQFPGGPAYYQPPMTEAEARRKLFGPKVDLELMRAFLNEVALDMTRPH